MIITSVHQGLLHLMRYSRFHSLLYSFSVSIYIKRKDREAGYPCFPPYNQPITLYLPSPSGKASFSGLSTASRLPFFRPSSSTEIAAAVNTPAIPASMPPINVHLLLMLILLFSCVNAVGGIFPAHSSSAVLNRLIVPIFLDDLQYSNSNRYPCQWVHTASLSVSSAEYAAGCG